MLISHRFRFIYTKTVKTAGTSVEAYFEPFCLPDDDHVVAHERDQYEGPSGVVGRRGANAHESKWYNHMPAAAIRDLVGDRLWGEYFKFCVVRNPFDKLISAFHMHEAGALPGLPGAGTSIAAAKTPASAWRRWFLPSRAEAAAAKSDCIVSRFRGWVRSGGWIDDRDKYLIEGRECVDYFVRFEQLQADLRVVCARLGLPFDLLRLPRLKSEYRSEDTRPVAEYYDPTTRAMVEERYGYELQRFGYAFPE